MMTLRTLVIPGLILSLLSGCGGDAGGESAPAEQAAAAIAADAGPDGLDPAEMVALDCVAQDLYNGLAEYVAGFRALALTRPVRDPYETDAEYTPRETAWAATLPGSVDSLIESHEPTAVRGTVREFRYDPGAESLIVTDFGDFAVPGVVVDASARLPYPAFHCQVGPFFACTTSARDDAWRRDVVANRVPLTVGEAPSVAVPAAMATQTGLAANPLEFEAVFALARPAASERLVPVVELRSVEFFSGGVSVARWEGEATLAGRTTLQRMMSFTPEQFGGCS